MRNLNWYLIIFHKIIIFERAGRDVQYVLIELCFYLISWILMSSCFWEKKIRLDSQRQTFLIFIWIFFFLKMACYHAILAICWRYPHFEMGLCLWTEEILAKYQNILISVLLSESSDESPFFISIVFKKKKKHCEIIWWCEWQIFIGLWDDIFNGKFPFGRHISQRQISNIHH